MPDAVIRKPRFPCSNAPIELCRTAEIRRQIVPCASVLCFSYAAAGRHSDCAQADRPDDG
jgi:hypothetical protein